MALEEVFRPDQKIGSALIFTAATYLTDLSVIRSSWVKAMMAVQLQRKSNGNWNSLLRLGLNCYQYAVQLPNVPIQAVATELLLRRLRKVNVSL